MPSIQQINQLHDLERLSQQLDDEPESLLAHVTGQPVAPAAMALNHEVFSEVFEDFGERELPGSTSPTELPPISRDQRELLSAAGRAVRKVQRDGEDADLTPEEEFAFEAIVLLVGRPAIFIQDGRFFPPPEEWQVLEGKRADIETACRSIGRIEVNGHPSIDWVGTGFLVAEDVVMTNRHVAEEFCQMGLQRRWRFKASMTGQIDYLEELGVINSAEFEFRNVIGVHEELDLALFRVRRTSAQGVAPPEPLTIASDAPFVAPRRQIYTCGFPAWDGRRNDPEPMMRIFQNVFNVKRLQPGEVCENRGRVFIHDCSTLGGNSGSAVIDLETGHIVGLHYGGRYQQGNFAIALWQLTDDPLLKKAKVNFA
jgi:hypothetical protein